MSSDTVVKIDNLWKRYGLPLPGFVNKGRRWLQRHLASKPRHTTDIVDNGPFALQNISLEVKRGETLGIMGHNGAGKSTLLKVLAGVTPPTRGDVEVKGRVFPMIELNAGIHPELSGRENARLLGAIMGLTRQETEDKLPQIEDFCELGEWFDRPARKYSTGMLARLGFGVALSVEADILLFDEILAVGDLSFQHKCFRHMEMLRSNGTTILLVSHNIRQIERLCEKAVILDRGQLTLEDTSVRVAAEYYEASHRQSYSQMQASSRDTFGRIQSSGQLNVEEVEVTNSEGDRIDTIPSGAAVGVRLRIITTSTIEQPVIGFAFVSVDMIVAASLSNDTHGLRSDLNGDVTVCCTIPNLYLNPGTYSIRVKVIDSGAGATLFSGEQMAALTITRPREEQDTISPYGGFIRLEAEWEQCK